METINLSHIQVGSLGTGAVAPRFFYGETSPEHQV